jgi:hypothetical protein
VLHGIFAVCAALIALLFFTDSHALKGQLVSNYITNANPEHHTEMMNKNFHINNNIY